VTLFYESEGSSNAQRIPASTFAEFARAVKKNRHQDLSTGLGTAAAREHASGLLVAQTRRQQAPR